MLTFDTVPSWLRDFVANLQPGDRVGITPAHEEAAGWNATFVRYEQREPNPRLAERGGEFAVVREDGGSERAVYIRHVHKPFNES